MDGTLDSSRHEIQRASGCLVIDDKKIHHHHTIAHHLTKRPIAPGSLGANTSGHRPNMPRIAYAPFIEDGEYRSSGFEAIDASAETRSPIQQ